MAYKNTYNVKSISWLSYRKMLLEVPGCVQQINACQNDTAACSAAQTSCNNEMIGPYEESGLNPYDVRIKCEVPVTKYSTMLLNIALCY